MDFSKEYAENRNKILKELYSWNCAERTKHSPISDNTHAALYVKGLIKDVLSGLYSIHGLIFGEVDDNTADRFIEAIIPIEKIADEYVVRSIDENMSCIDFEEI